MDSSFPRVIDVEVTRDHIDRGMPRSACHCPVSIALSEKMSVDDIYVTKSHVWINNTSYVTTNNLRRFLLRYDTGRKVVPSKFTLKETIQKSGDHDGRDNTPSDTNL